MKIFICDDDLNTITMLTKWITDYMENQDFQIKTYCTGTDVIYEIEHSEEMEPLIIFMDIKLKRDNGINVAKVIKKINPKALIIFISGYSEYFEESFEAEPVYFLIKPLKKEIFLKAMEKAIEKMNQNKRKYLLLRKKEMSRIFFDDIYYAESDVRKVRIHCQQGNMEYYEKLDILEQMLEGDFIRCHKSYLVNMKWIQSMDNKNIVLMNDVIIPISRTRLVETKEKVFEYLGRQLG